MKPNATVVIRTSLSALSVIGAAASIYAVAVGLRARWALPVVLIAALLLLIAGVMLLRMLSPVLRTNLRRVPLVSAVQTVGLTDIESRNEGDRHLPPELIYKAPGIRELVISGITASSSFKNHMSLIRSLLDDRADVYFLICSETTGGIDKISKIELRDVIAELKQVKYVVEQEGLLSDQHFHIRTYDYLPSFTAVMIDGDIAPRNGPPRDLNGLIRIQPRRLESTHHDGIVLQFKNTSSALDGFNLFATDIRAQWRASKPWK